MPGECRGAMPLCWGFGSIPQLLKSPKTGGFRGFKKMMINLFQEVDGSSINT
jgi:hypothetical protein